MAMLAEPKRRDNWTLNPRGTLWSNDENKFGQKLMEKFGWSKGKGLGRTEQGIQEHIKVDVKNNSKGIGFKGAEDQWVKHYEGFESVLASLNSENNSDADTSANTTANNSDGEGQNGQSLEKRSKGSKARVHYHKFTRGKDLRRYNADDIGCITGAKRSKIMSEQEKQEDTFEPTEVGQTEKMDGVTTIKGKNMQEYFAEKMAQLKAKASGLEVVKTEESPSSEEQVNETLTKKKKKKKNKRTEMEIDQEAPYLSDPTVEEAAAGEVQTSAHIEEKDNTDQTSKKKKKKKKNKDIESVKQEAEEKIAEEVTDQMEIKKKKKKKKSKKSVVEADQQQKNIEEVSTTQEAQPANDVNPASTEEKKKKKKKRQIAEVAVEEPGTSEEVEHIPKKKRKVSSDKPEEEESHVEVKEEKNRVESNEETNVNLENGELKKSKKKKKSKKQKRDKEHEEKEEQER